MLSSNTMNSRDRGNELWIAVDKEDCTLADVNAYIDHEFDGKDDVLRLYQKGMRKFVDDNFLNKVLKERGGSVKELRLQFCDKLTSLAVLESIARNWKHWISGIVIIS